jgi:hypothetical protein
VSASDLAVSRSDLATDFNDVRQLRQLSLNGLRGDCADREIHLNSKCHRDFVELEIYAEGRGIGHIQYVGDPRERAWFSVGSNGEDVNAPVGCWRSRCCCITSINIRGGRVVGQVYGLLGHTRSTRRDGQMQGDRSEIRYSILDQQNVPSGICSP